MEKLKPCPFCCGEPYIEEYEPRLLRPVRNHPYSIWCYECNLSFGWDYDYGGEFDTKKQAAEAWNRRADTVKRGEWKRSDVMLDPECDTVKCSECGYMVATERGKSGSPYCPRCGTKMDD